LRNKQKQTKSEHNQSASVKPNRKKEKKNEISPNPNRIDQHTPIFSQKKESDNKTPLNNKQNQ